MNIRINSTDDFCNFLIKEYGNDFSLVSKEEIPDEDAYNSAFGITTGTLVVTFVVNIASNFMYDAICNYYKTHRKESLKITTSSGIKSITPENLNEDNVKSFFCKITPEE